MQRTFNTAGPCSPDRDYMLPPMERLPEAPGLVKLAKYFVVHGPRQTGKTTTIRAIAQSLTASGTYAAMVFSCERAVAGGEDHLEAQRLLLEAIRSEAWLTLPEELRPPEMPADTQVFEALAQWAMRCPRPLVLFIDEIDSLIGPSLISVLRQIRAGYVYRPTRFPASVILRHAGCQGLQGRVRRQSGPLRFGEPVQRRGRLLPTR